MGFKRKTYAMGIALRLTAMVKTRTMAVKFPEKGKKYRKDLICMLWSRSFQYLQVHF